MEGPLGRQATTHLLASILNAALEDRVGPLATARAIVTPLATLVETALRRLGAEGATALGLATVLETTLDDGADPRLAGIAAGVRRRTVRPPAGLEATVQEFLRAGLATLGLVTLLDAGSVGLAHAIATSLGARRGGLALV